MIENKLPLTNPPFGANIGSGGPDVNSVGFPRVKAYMKAKMSPLMSPGMTAPTQAPVPSAEPSFVSNVDMPAAQGISSRADISGNRH